MQTNAEHLTKDLNELLNEFGRDFSELVFVERFKNNGISFDISYLGIQKSYSFPFHYENEREISRFEKRYAKLAVYNALTEILGETLPWGALTGIRPTKLARGQGPKWRSFFTDLMCVSEKKTALTEKILEVQKPYIDGVGEVYDLFVSIPLCPTRCEYCSFISEEIGKEKAVNEYIEALIREIECAKALNKPFRSVYVGGGTPVALSDEDFEKVLSAIGKQTVEYTVEAGRPDAITEKKLEIMKRYGVTRVCVNPQTFSDKTLDLIGRKHTAKEVIDKYHLVKSYGFLVNNDLIAGLPEETFDDFKHSLDTAISLSPENITVHTLALKSGSKLKERTDRLDGALVSKMIDYSQSALNKADYEPYYLYRQKYMAGNLENVGYSKRGFECVYNIDIMEEFASIIACGANAITKLVKDGGKTIERLGAPKNISAYLLRLDEIIEKKSELFE